MSAPRRILMIDDDTDVLLAMRIQLRGLYGVLTAASIAEGMSILKDQDVDLVLLDVGLDGENGLDGVKKIKEVHPLVNVAMLSGRRDIKTVVEAIRAGAIDYLTKPVSNDQISEVMEKAVSLRDVRERCDAMVHSHSTGIAGRSGIVCKGEKMKTLLELAKQVKGHNASVLIIGETGTGKELLARHINEQEGDQRRPFIAVNCAAIPEQLLESELFGHEAGAFTGANRRRIGKFELADGGDIFLDEIGTMKLDLQVKLLRVLQEREFCRLGSNTPIRANFRVISASNQLLEDLVENGNFRSDLYHRLKVIQLTVPPLRERKSDIPVLIEHFAKNFSRGKDVKKISDEALNKLVAYSWPGNVRELANVVQSLVIMAKGETIDEASFPNWVLNGESQYGVNNLNGTKVPSDMDTIRTLKEHVRAVEKQCIERALQSHNGDKSKAAASLGICRTTFYMKLKELGLM